MRYIEAPAYQEFFADETRLFLAGGISGCPNWQQPMAALLSDTDVALMNPRRQYFPIDNPDDAQEQIRWEFYHLRIATIIAFWFPCEALCPIALYELGAWTVSHTPIFVGTHPDYQRRQDVEIQTRLVRPQLQVVSSLAALAAQIKNAL